MKKIVFGIILTAVLLVSSIIYLLLNDEDPYRNYTGLGKHLALSEDDQQLAFSYYKNGLEAIYVATSDGKEINKISNPKEERHRAPAFSPDKRKILFLSQNKKDIQSLYTANIDGTNPEKLTKDDLHVGGAVFAADGKSIYFSAIEAVEIKKTEGETKAGRDLFEIGLDGTGMKKLTDQDFYTMENMTLAADGKKLYFKDYDSIYEYNFEQEQAFITDFSHRMPAEYFHFSLSPEKNLAAYTSVTEESKDTSLFKYDLFLRDLESKETKRLTDLDAAIESPLFFNNRDQMIFLKYENWPNEPEEYALHKVDFKGKALEEINMVLPGGNKENLLVSALNKSVNGNTVAILYIVLLLLLTLYFGPKRKYLPSLISLGIGSLAVIGSIAAAALVDPWMGIGIGMLAGGILVCSLIPLIFAFVWGRFSWGRFS